MVEDQLRLLAGVGVQAVVCYFAAREVLRLGGARLAINYLRIAPIISLVLLEAALVAPPIVWIALAHMALTFFAILCPPCLIAAFRLFGK